MATVTILVNGQPTTVEEVRPGLYGELGYKYTSTSTSTAPKTTSTSTKTSSTGTSSGGTSGVITDNVTGNQYTMGSGGYYVPYLPKTTAPSTATTTSSGGFQMPSLSPSTSDGSSISGLLGYYDQLFKTYDQQQQDYRTQIAEQQKIQQAQTQPFLKKLLGMDSPAEVREDAWETTGIDPKQYFAQEKATLSEIGKLNEELNATIAAKDQAVAQSYDKLASNSFINNQIAQIERNAAPRINMMSANIKSKAAILEAMQGRFNEARAFVNQAVEDATADLKFNYDMFRTFYDLNQDIIDRLDTKYQDAFKAGVEIAEKKWTYAVEQTSAVGELLIKYPKAGISISDSIEDAYTKISLNPEAAGLGELRTVDGVGVVSIQPDGSYTVIVPEGGGSGGGGIDSIETYAQAYLNGEIEVTNIPEKFRAQAIARANELAAQALNAPEPVPTQPSRGTLGYLPSTMLDTTTSFFSNLFGN